MHFCSVRSPSLQQERHFGHGEPAKKKLEIKYRTNQLEHEFGRPYQLGHHKYSSRVEDSDLACFHVVPGDVIVMGTDGLLDNVSEKVRNGGLEGGQGLGNK